MINNFCIMFWNNAGTYGIEVIRAHRVILYCSSMFDLTDALLVLLLKTQLMQQCVQLVLISF